MGHPQPGDVLLVKSPRKAWAVGRRVMGTPYDHLALVIRGDQVLNVVWPRAVRTPLSRMLRPNKMPVLLRPAWPSEAVREGFVDALERLWDVPYDTARAASFLLRLALRRALGVRLPLRPPSMEGPRYTCTDTAVLALCAALPSFEGALRTLPLDYAALSCASTTDFLRIAELRPDLLRREAL